MAAPVSSRLRLFSGRFWRDFLPAQDFERRSQRNERPVPMPPMELSLLHTGDLKSKQRKADMSGPRTAILHRISNYTRSSIPRGACAGLPLDWPLQQRGLLLDGKKVR